MTCSKSGCKEFVFNVSTLVGGYKTILCESHTDEWDTFVKQTEEYPALQKIEIELGIVQLRLMAMRSEVGELALRELFEKHSFCLQKLYEIGRAWVKKEMP